MAGLIRAPRRAAGDGIIVQLTDAFQRNVASALARPIRSYFERRRFDEAGAKIVVAEDDDDVSAPLGSWLR
ncbi:hypothetical protein [Mesorhizobium sp.]|uniref:hypothetical protein n=1 Tax=Mesorhizobium sp. TaxID=1871066 RepID=UPI00120506E6|nr:hypothetical protein [Mesorhizobium sp.]TIN05875.1 MAG: hypothetical protein E5Y14_31390 [Mesorhizobium sp.]